MNSISIYLIFFTLIGVTTALVYFMNKLSENLKKANKQAVLEGKIIVEEIRSIRKSVIAIADISSDYQNPKAFNSKQVILFSFDILKDLLSIKKNAGFKTISILKMVFKILNNQKRINHLEY